ncbi:S41 family peptidase [Maribellus maritimus]|uniref:S41 family peptidase n=1 Tax=Maribellus maritimus TaxID=2870838 RepID=UPI001EEBCFED|nr:S41 family peptidase [Maribellus maritimus]MCG6191409.1 hypothetical protein [Maribellus maritimus]
MKYILPIILLLVGCSREIDSNRNRFSQKELTTDFEILREVLEEAHHGLYMYTNKDEFNFILDSIQNCIIDSMSVTDYYRLIVLSLTDKIQCGHTGIYPPKGIFTKLIPIDVFVVKDDIYINRIYDSIIDLKGIWKLKSINGFDAKSIFKTLREGIPSDGNNNNFKDRIIEVDFPMYFTQLVGEADTFKLQVIDINSDKDTSLFVSAINRDKLNKARSNYPIRRDNKLDFKIIDGLNTAYLKIGSFEGWRLEQQEFNYDKYILNTFDSIQKLGIENLIIDLKWNMGGDTDKGAYLLSFLYDNPFQFYYKVTASSNHYKNLKYTDKDWKWNFDIRHDHKKNEKGEYVAIGMDNVFKPQKEVFKGEVYFLINGCSHSTASSVSALAQYLKIGKLVGESPSGAYSGYNGGNWIGLTLPNTKIYVAIPIRTFHNAIDSSIYKTNYIRPDYLIKYSIEEKIKDSDLELDKALELIRLKKNN